MGTLHIQPLGGLGNRLRSLASAMWVAEDLGLDLVMTWEPDHNLGSPFPEVFRNRFRRPPPGLEASPTRFLEQPTTIHGMIRAGDPEDMVYHVVSCQAFSHRPEIEAYSRPFWIAIRPHLLRLRPVRSVARTVRRLGSRFTPKTLGVHVRAGLGGMGFDQAAHIESGLFFPEIDEYLSDDPRARFFLACDSPEVTEAFRSRYGDRLVYQASGTENGVAGDIGPAGIRMALADMLLLSKTERILGSYFSSFSEIASVLGACPVKRIGRDVEGPGCEEDYLDLVPWSFRGSSLRRWARRVRGWFP